VRKHRRIHDRKGTTEDGTAVQVICDCGQQFSKGKTLLKHKQTCGLTQEETPTECQTEDLANMPIPNDVEVDVNNYEYREFGIIDDCTEEQVISSAVPPGANEQRKN